MKLFPYLNFKGNCEEALNFYKDALDGEILQMGRYGDSPVNTNDEYKNKIVHGRLKFGDALIMASDSTNAADEFNNNITLSVECETGDQLESAFTKMGEGGKVTMPLQDQFWGAKFGMLTDKFGVHWMFNCEKKN